MVQVASDVYLKPGDEHFVVVDISANAHSFGGKLRAFLTGQCGGHEDWESEADVAFVELAQHEQRWFNDNVIVLHDCDRARAPEVFEHYGMRKGYSGGGVAIHVRSRPPQKIVALIRKRAELYEQKLTHGDSRQFTLIGVRLVKKTSVLNVVAE